MSWTSVAVLHAVSSVTTLWVLMALIHTRMSPCTNLSSFATSNLCFTLPLEQLEETLGPTHSPGSAKVEPRTLRHLCFVWVEATPNLSNPWLSFKACPSSPSSLEFPSTEKRLSIALFFVPQLCFQNVLAAATPRFSSPKTKPSGAGPSCPCS